MSDCRFYGRVGDVYEGMHGGHKKFFYSGLSSGSVSESSHEGKALDFLLQNPNKAQFSHTVAANVGTSSGGVESLMKRIRGKLKQSPFFSLEISETGSSYKLVARAPDLKILEKITERDAELEIVPEVIGRFDKSADKRFGDIYAHREEEGLMLSVGRYENPGVLYKSDDGKLLFHLYKHRGNYFDEVTLVESLGLEDRDVFVRVGDLFDESVFFDFQDEEFGPGYGLTVRTVPQAKLQEIVERDKDLLILHEIVFPLVTAS